jgi:hypothetical protein
MTRSSAAPAQLLGLRDQPGAQGAGDAAERDRRARGFLAAEGFAPLPRRLDEERPARISPNAQAIANVGDFVLCPREFSTRTGGLFLFIPDLVRLDGDALGRDAKLPGSRMIPAAHALRASLALKLWAIERKSHIMALVADEGLALFCGLNAMPKKSFLSEYSSRITPQKVSRLLALWHVQLTSRVRSMSFRGNPG